MKLEGLYLSLGDPVYVAEAYFCGHFYWQNLTQKFLWQYHLLGLAIR